MGIEDKQTYGEYYWAMQVEATAAFDEQMESAFAPYFRGILADIPDISELPAGIRNLVGALAEPPSAGFGGFALGVGIETIDEVLHSVMKPMMKMLEREYNRRSRETWLTSEQANILFRQGKIEKDFWNLTVASEGYEDILGRFLYDSQMPYPSIPDLVTYARYHGDPDNPWSEVQKWFDVSARDWPVWKWLGLQRLTTLQLQSLYKRGKLSEPELFTELSRVGWDSNDRSLIKDLGYTIPNAMLLMQGNLQQGQSDEKILSDISIADIHPDYARNYFDAILTKPSTQDIISYNLRLDPTLSELPADLRKIGIHPDYNDVYKTLAYPIPPVADIITMAVREAFTPDIAARFGQYEDYPQDLQTWGEKKGLSAEWTKRYWAAHWSLPSASQGFEMLHRGIVDENELNMLLRALDVMPFWRNKLVKMAYRRVTRVDIRRMYNIGVVDEAEVFEAYVEQGYNERDASRMTEFTIKQTLATQSKFTARDIVSAYSNYMINRSEAESLLRTVGVRDENISFIIESAEFKREWELNNDRIAAIRNLYKRAVYDDNKARGELLKLNLPAERVDVLMEQWYIDEKDKPVRRWTTAQTLGFIKDGLITSERGTAELRAIGYDSEHIDIYMKAAK